MLVAVAGRMVDAGCGSKGARWNSVLVAVAGVDGGCGLMVTGVWVELRVGGGGGVDNCLRWKEWHQCWYGVIAQLRRLRTRLKL